MPLEFDDRGLNIFGLGERGLNFYDNARQLRASIYLDASGRLNIGNLQINVSGSGDDVGGPVSLADIPFVTLAGSALLHNERVLAAGAGLQATDEGAGNNYTLRLGTPGALSAQSTNAVTATSHTHTVAASANPGAAEWLLKSTPGGALTLQQLNVDNLRLDGNALSAQSGDLTLTAAGGDVLLPSAINIGADNFVSQLTGWRVSYAGNADFRSIYADELHVKAFIADIEQALAGGQIISKSVALLSRDFVVPVAADIALAHPIDNYVGLTGNYVDAITIGQSFNISGSMGNDGNYTVANVNFDGTHTRVYTNESIADGTSSGRARFRRTLWVEDLPGFADAPVFETNDWLRFRVIDRSGGGLVVADVWARVGGGYTDQPGGEQSWSITAEDSGGVHGNTVNAGAVVLDYGQSGDGWHEVTALDPDGPYSQIVTWTTRPDNPANYTLRSRLGNLDGVTDADFPSIGGWGLYSTNVFLKGAAQLEGSLSAAGGTVVIGDDGITIDGAFGFDNPDTHIRWLDGGVGGSLICNIGTTIDGSDNPDGMIIDQKIADGILWMRSDRFVLEATAGGGGDMYAAMGDGEINLGNDSLTIDYANGRVGIGGSPSYPLDVQDNVADYVARIFNDGNDNSRRGLLIQAGSDANPTNAFLRFNDGNGDIVGYVEGDGSGGVNYQTSSDERTKQDIEVLDGALAKVLALEPITYRGRGAPQSKTKRAGLVAQRVQNVLPELVSEMDGMLTLNYTGVIPFLIGAIQELSAKVATLEAR